MSNNQNSKQNVATPKKKRGSYRNDLRTAYQKGYVKGWDDAYDIPNRFGARQAAAHGYSKGVRNHKKADKYTAKYNNSKQKTNK